MGCTPNYLLQRTHLPGRRRPGRGADLPPPIAIHRLPPIMFEARFQSFDDPQPANTGPRVQALRSELSRRGLSGFVLPRADRHQNEFLPPSEERLAWLTGFSGSAGAAVVLGDRAVLFVDGRYTLQARNQVDPALFSIVHSGETPV